MNCSTHNLNNPCLSCLKYFKIMDTFRTVYAIIIFQLPYSEMLENYLGGIISLLSVFLLCSKRFRAFCPMCSLSGLHIPQRSRYFYSEPCILSNVRLLSFLEFLLIHSTGRYFGLSNESCNLFYKSYLPPTDQVFVQKAFFS